MTATRPAPPACSCPDPAMCARLSRHMPKRSWEWYTCNCPPEEPCDPEGCAAYRERVDRAARLSRDNRSVLRLGSEDRFYVKALGWMVGRPPLRQILPAVRFLAALSRHARDWFRLVREEEYGRRVAVCTSCPFYSRDYPGGRCSKCGCGVQGQIGNKESSPEPSRWKIISWLRWRWSRVWGKAWWKSEDCPVCRRCDRKISEGCCCQPFESKWKEGIIPLTVIAKFPSAERFI